MKIEELDSYLQSLRDWLTDHDFININKYGYEKYFGETKFIYINLHFKLQFVEILDANHLQSIDIYNSDVNGNLTIEYLEQLIKTIYWNKKDK